MINPFHTHFLTGLREQLRKHPLRIALPVSALAGSALAAAILMNSCTICYTVSSNGQQVAYCNDTAVVQAALDQAENRAAAILHAPFSFDTGTVSVRAALAPKDEIESEADMTESLLQSIPQIQHVYALTVDGVYVGAVESASVLESALNEVEQRYQTEDTISVHVDSQVSIDEKYVPAEQVVLDRQAVVDALLEESPKSFSYIVQESDDPVSITENFGMTLARLQELNPNLELAAYVEAESILNGCEQSEEEEEAAQPEVSPYAALALVSKAQTEEEKTDRPGEKAEDPYAALALVSEQAEQAEEEQEEEALRTVSVRDFLTDAENPLKAGQTITIEQSCPLLEVTTVEETAFIRAIEPERQVEVDNTLFAGQERIIQEGEAGYADVVARQVRRCGTVTVSVDLSVDTTSEPVPMIVATGSAALPDGTVLSPDGLFLWPVQGRISSDFGYRYIFGSTNFHRGVDIAASMGTAICAADAGTVEFAGVRGTYGNLVVLSHPSGLYTYYGHCSKFYVKAGDVVSAGDVIAAVGSTGRSTGPHCHFEVRYQNAPIDPLQFLPGENNAPVRSVPVSTAAELMPASTVDTGLQASASSGASASGSGNSSNSSSVKTSSASGGNRTASSAKSTASGKSGGKTTGQSASSGETGSSAVSEPGVNVSGDVSYSSETVSGDTSLGTDSQSTAGGEAAESPAPAASAPSAPAPSAPASAPAPAPAQPAAEPKAAAAVDQNAPVYSVAGPNLFEGEETQQ